MKFSLDAWIPPALVFGIVVAGAVTSTHSVKAQSTDENSPVINAGNVGKIEFTQDDLALEAEFQDPSAAPLAAPLAPVAPLQPFAVVPLASLPPLDAEPTPAGQLPLTVPFATDPFASEPTISTFVPAVGGLPGVSSIPAAPSATAAPGAPSLLRRVQVAPVPPKSPLTVARVQEIHSVPSNGFVIAGGPADEKPVNVATGLFTASADRIAASPKSQEFEKKARQIAEQIRKSKTDEQTTELKTELKDITRQHFEHLESQRLEQIQSLESKLSKLKELLQSRTVNSDKIIDRRMNQLLGVTDALDFYAESTIATSHLSLLQEPGYRDLRLLGTTAAKPAEASSRPAKESKVIEMKLQAQAERARADAEAVHSKIKSEALVKERFERELSLQKGKVIEVETQIKRLEEARMQLEAARKQAMDAERKLNNAKKFQ